MRQRVGIDTDGRLSLRKGEGEGEGLTKSAARIDPLTFVLSPFRRGEARKQNDKVAMLRK